MLTSFSSLTRTLCVCLIFMSGFLTLNAQSESSSNKPGAPTASSRYLLLSPMVVLRTNGLSAGGIVEYKLYDCFTAGVYGAMNGLGESTTSSFAFGSRGSLLVLPALEVLLGETVDLSSLEPYVGVSAGYNYYLNSYFGLLGFYHYGAFVGGRYYFGPLAVQAELGKTIDGGWGLQGGIALKLGR